MTGGQSVSIGQIMFDMDSVKVLHLEPTSNCNAACPQCDRYQGNSLNPNLVLNDLSLDTIKEKLSEKFVRQLDKMFMCGNHGDPAASVNTLEIYRWFREVNPTITLGMNTNGGLKTVDFWIELAKIINRERDYVVFSIDGLEDTNQIYRRNVVWDRLINNVKAFINAGGRAHWDMIIFKHNEHQIEKAKTFANDMGFVEFRYKVSRRFGFKPVDYLEPPSFAVNFHTEATDIKCAALEDKSIYMDSMGRILPCCWIGIDTVNNKSEWKVQGFVPSKDISVCSKICGIIQKSNFEKQWITV
jgi:MoaA/NifB/PqqE/SkfB family radical SAM enzyme